MSRIYIVEDDENIRDLVLYALQNSGFEVQGFVSSVGFFQAIQEERCDLVLLDVMLPQESGFDVLKRMKQSELRTIPVVMLTAKSQEFDKIRGLDGGADDYITKPFSVMELISRVKAVLRRTQGSADGVLRFQTIEINTKGRVVTVDGVVVNLTFKEFELLVYLMKHTNVVLSREQIMQVVWSFDFEGESRTVDMHIKSLRQKLGEGSVWLHTVRSVGYKIGD